MAQQKQTNGVRLTTPKGTLLWPWLVEPDTKYKEAGEYRTQLRLPADTKETQEIVRQIEAVADAALEEALEEATTPKAKKAVKLCEDLPFALETDDDGNETGYILIRAKRSASWVDKATDEVHEIHVPIFDLAGIPMDTEGLRIRSGTEAKLAIELRPFYATKLGAGCTIRLRGVQIIKLVSAELTAAALGFSDESDGVDFPSDVDEDEPVAKAPARRKAAAKVKTTVKAKATDDSADDDDDEDTDGDF